MSWGSIYYRRDRDNAFAASMKEALQIGYVRLEMAMLERRPVARRSGRL